MSDEKMLDKLQPADNFAVKEVHHCQMMSYLLQPEQFYDKLGHGETLPVTSVPLFLEVR